MANMLGVVFAIRSFFAALRERPSLAGELARGLRAIEAGRHAEATEALNAALLEATDARERARIYNKLGVACITAGRRDEALAGFADALDCDSACAPALVNIGNLLLDEGHPADALAYYDAAIVADETYALAHRNRGIVLRRLGRRSESVSALRKADRLEARPRGARA